MNCFQKSYLWLLNTTGSRRRESHSQLWIAFKNLIFDYWTQLIHQFLKVVSCCELLSKILSLTIEHNTPRKGLHWPHVVNCFQKSYLWLLNTTAEDGDYTTDELWIAFKNLIFDYWTQHIKFVCFYDNGCELLSKILSLTIEHNWRR